jgi:hypothetical protein
MVAVLIQEGRDRQQAGINKKCVPIFSPDNGKGLMYLIDIGL